MHKYLLLFGAVTAMSGCGADVAGACKNYLDAVNQCFSDYGDANDVDMSASELPDSYCDDTYGSTKDKASADYLNCLADAYSNVDCSDSSAYAGIDISGCTPP